LGVLAYRSSKMRVAGSILPFGRDMIEPTTKPIKRSVMKR